MQDKVGEVLNCAQEILFVIAEKEIPHNIGIMGSLEAGVRLIKFNQKCDTVTAIAHLKKVLEQIEIAEKGN